MVFPVSREQAYSLIQITFKRLASYYTDDEILSIIASLRGHSQVQKRKKTKKIA
jgi:hypothetical protein